MVNYHLTGGGLEIFDVTNYASHVCHSGKLLSRLLSYLRDEDAFNEAAPPYQDKIAKCEDR